MYGVFKLIGIWVPQGEVINSMLYSSYQFHLSDMILTSKLMSCVGFSK